MVRYEDFQRHNAYLYDCEAFDLTRVKHVYAGVLPESPDNGRIILMRFGKTANTTKTGQVRVGLAQQG